MILNISGRCDIVAFYTPWLLKRLKEGYVDVRNPFNKHMVSRIYFEDVDIYSFCTKNPLPIIPYLHLFKKPIIFQVTITPYKEDIEVNVKNKDKIIKSLKAIKDIVGIDNVFVRYDPIFLSKKYTLEYHLRAFERLCSLIQGNTKRIIVSFLDRYKNVEKNLPYLGLVPFRENDYEIIGKRFSSIASKYNIRVQTCCEKRNLVEYGFIKSDCVSKEYAYKLSGKKFKKWKSRPCNCAELVDIGVYNTCEHLCKYCYANYDEVKIRKNILKHDDNSSLLIGKLEDDDKIIVRKY